MSHKEIRKEIEEHRSSLIDTLSDLVAIPTINPPGQSYRECVEYLSRKLKDWDIDHDIISGPDGDYPRFSVVGLIGEGKDILHWHAHYDVVPADSSDQFKPCLKGHRLYGRGSSDMKSGLVSMLFALRLIKESARKLKGKITFSIVPDEETGGDLGTKYLMESGYLPQANLGMLMPEPTSGVIWNANKGALTFKVTITGKSAHVGLEHQGINAFEDMIKVAHSLLDLKEDIQKRKTRLTIKPSKANRSVMLIGGKSGSGFNFNVVPARAFFTIDRRLNPEESMDEAKKELMEILEKQKKKGIGIEVDLLQEGEPSASLTETRLSSMLKKSIADVTGKAAAFELCPGLCEIRFFNKKGIPAYAYGPGLLEVSHGPEEYVEINDVLDCAAIYLQTGLRLLS